MSEETPPIPAKLYYKRIEFAVFYGWEVDVIISSDLQRCIEQAAKLYGAREAVHIYELMDNGCDGFVTMAADEDGTKHILLSVNDIDNVSLLTHEIVHVSWRLEGLLDLGFDYNSQEVQAYICEFVMREILKMKPPAQ